MKRWGYSKKLMTAVCLMFAAILSLCSINVLNFTNLNTTTIEEVADDTSNENDTSSDEKFETSDDETNEEENSQSEEENNATDEEINNDNTNSETTENENNLNNNESDTSTDTSEEDDLDDVVTAAINISTQDDLFDIANGASGTYTLTNNITLTKNWTPIKKFSGIFNGNGYTISGINVISANNGYAGFFGQLSGTVSNVIFQGTVNVSSASYIGGVAGYNSGSISYVWNQVSVTNNTGRDIPIGGITGYNNGSISYCMNSGSVIGGMGICYAGGIAGDAGSPISNCYNNASISGRYAGGIVGRYYDNGNISYCINSGFIRGDKYSGGIAGSFGVKSLILNKPLGSISHCVNSGSVGWSGDDGNICGFADTNLSYCYYTDTSIPICGVENDTTTSNCDSRSSLASAISSAGISYNSSGISNTWTGVTGGVILSTFVKIIGIEVYVEGTDGYYSSVGNNSSYGVGYITYLSGSGSIYYRVASTNTTSIISNIVNNSNGKYKYVGMYDSNSWENLISSEFSYSASYYDIDADSNGIYIRFDLDEKEINVNVYYSEELSFGGEIPNTIYSGTVGGTASLTSSSTGESASSGSRLTITTVDKDWILIEANAKTEYELVGLFAGNAGDSRSQCVNILNNGSISDDVLVTYSNTGNLNLVEYLFMNSNITSGGEMLTEYSVVFARYQYSGISFSQSYRSDRTGFPSSYYGSKTSLIYGFTSRSLAYTNRERRDNSPAFYNDLTNVMVSEIELSGGQYSSSSNPYFLGDGYWYVGVCDRLDFYWGGVEEQEFNFQNATDSQFANLGISIADEGGSLPRLEVDLYTYFQRMVGTVRTSGITYLNFGNTIYKNASFEFKEFAPVLSQSEYDLYFVDMFEEIDTNNISFGEQGGEINLIYN